MAAQPVIEVSGLRKSYGRLEAVRGLDLVVEEGEIVAVLGPNGAGKTTTVEILEGYRERTSGEVRALGEDPARGGRDWTARVGIMLQTWDVQPDLTVRESLEQFAGYYPRPRDVDEIAELVGLTEQRDTRAGRLSGGQQRRLDMGLALVGNPELLFLDEPTTGFDPMARRAAWQIVASLRDAGTTVLTAARERGLLKRVRKTPLPAWAFIAGRMAMSAETSALLVIVLAGLGRFVYGVTLPTNTIPGALLTLVVGTLAFSALGIALTAAISSDNAAVPIVNAIILPLYFISGVFIPVEQIPRGVQTVAGFFPVKRLYDAFLVAFDPTTTGAGIDWASLGVVAAWGVAGAIVGVRTFRWSPRSQ